MHLKDIKGFDSYQISSSGQVFSCLNLGGWGKTNIYHEIKSKKTNRGHLEVCLRKNGKDVYRKVHRLVAEAFIELKYNRYKVYHIDGNKENNSVDNLEIRYDNRDILEDLKKESINIFDKDIQYKTLPQYNNFWFGSDGTCIKQKTNGLYVKIMGSIGLNGYITISIDNKKHYLHHLICEAFHGPRPYPHYHCCHKNDIRTDNRSNNLRWDSPKGNSEDRVRLGNSRGGEVNNLSKLNDEKVLKIRHLYKEGVSQSKLSKIFNVSRPNISAIVNYKSWKHLP